MKTKIENYAKELLENIKVARDVLKEYIKDDNVDLISKGLAELQYNTVEDLLLSTVIDILMITRDLKENEEGFKVVEDFVSEVLEKNEERTEE